MTNKISRCIPYGRQKISEWYDWLDDQSKSPLEACMSYALSFPEIDRVIVDVDTLHQLKQIVRVARYSKTDLFPDITSENQNLINPANWEI
jgi:predicted aldo/keto reductase-like oxidoreductase